MSTIKFQFEYNGATYTEKVSESGRSTYWVYYEQSESGKVFRTTKEAYELGFQKYLDEQKTLAELEDTEIPDDTAAILDELNREQNEANEFTNIGPKEIEERRAKKVRRSKDVAYEDGETTLTAKQVDFIRHLPDTEFWEHGVDSCIWVDCLCEDIKGQFEDKPMTVGAMVSTLCEKGLGIRVRQKVNGRTATSFELTTKGKLIAGELLNWNK